jgi:hypothetical protein
MADLVLASLKKALSLVPHLSPKLIMIDTMCRVVGYASRKNDELFLQAIDKGMYKMDKSNQMVLYPDDDDKLGFSGDDDDGDDSVVVVVSDVDSLMNNMKGGVRVPPVGYSYTGKLAFLCFVSVSKFTSMNLSTEERKKGSRASICKIQEEKATIERVTGIGRGDTQQNRMQFGLMAQNEDSAAQAHCDMCLVTIMKRAS